MSIMIKPIITEKVTEESELYNRYGFVVDKKANKVQIKKAVEAAYGVSVDQSEHDECRPRQRHEIHQKWCSAGENKCL